MLYLVATPIGNLKDITLRAIETLRDVDYIACEDTRKSKILLKTYNIKKPLISFYEHNEEQAGERIISLLKNGKTVALITNGGTPCISDPGFTLVRRAIEAGINITVIPGATAFVLALVLSGLPVHSFTFRGFPPHKSGPRHKFLNADKSSPYTLIYYESPYRIKKFLKDAIEIFGDRQSAIANELTKKFEKLLRGKLSELLDKIDEIKVRGEYTIVIAGAKETTKARKN
jgi:16S rRNA (cytidine1402-2'-O)-methyltransferase